MSKQYILVSIAFIAMLGVVGCSNSDKTTAPLGDTVAPIAVEQFEGTIVSGQDPAVNLSWKPGPELDLAGYRVYRSTNGGTSELVATIAQAQWSDSSILRSTDYIYELAAFDEASNEGPRVSTGTLNLAKGASAQPRLVN